MYSDMSTWIIASSSLNRNSASVRASSVFPTPDGPRKMNDAVGRFGSLMPARARRIAFETASDRLLLADVALVQLVLHAHEPLGLLLGELEDRDARPHRDDVGDLLLADLGLLGLGDSLRQLSSSSRFFCVSLRSLSRRLAAFSNSCASIAASLSLRTFSISSSSSR